MIDIILPTFNETKTGLLEKLLQNLNSFKQINIIAVNTHGNDKTLKILKKYNCHIVNTNANSRAQRINEGIKVSKADIVILHHPRSILSKDFFVQINKLEKDIMWGAFTHKFDTKHLLLRFTSFYSNHIRGDIFKTYYLDHCLFFRKQIINDVFPIDQVEIFEDTLICKRAKKFKSCRLTSISLTSAIRFITNGVYKQAFLNQKMKWMYYLNANHTKMNKEYEKNTGLNNRYE
ncbi:MAG: glycosyltransferase [Bacteriovoracaceae bacterium]|jgi:cellulose synthase/poly-beta-1,6-N-acetylglucosamine synthase-like glycosyltransferase|nr:glycosyltransferase [Bacteriovoracaceae bacterium]